MTSVTNIVGIDRASTPVTHTYTAFQRDVNGVMGFKESGASPVGDSIVTVSSRKTAAGKYKTTLKLAAPVVQNSTVNGVTVPVVVRTAYAEISFTFDGTSTVQERKDITNICNGFLSYATNPNLIDGVITGNGGLY